MSIPQTSHYLTFLDFLTDSKLHWSLLKSPNNLGFPFPYYLGISDLLENLLGIIGQHLINHMLSKLVKFVGSYIFHYVLCCTAYMRITHSPSYMGITHSTLPRNNGNLPLPFFGGNYPIVILNNIYSWLYIYIY